MELTPKQKVAQLVDCHNELAMTLLKINSLIKKLPSEQLKPYKEEMRNLLQEYHVVKAALVDGFKEYFRFERENNLPVEFNYRKIYRALERKQ